MFVTSPPPFKAVGHLFLLLFNSNANYTEGGGMSGVYSKDHPDQYFIPQGPPHRVRGGCILSQRGQNKVSGWANIQLLGSSMHFDDDHTFNLEYLPCWGRQNPEIKPTVLLVFLNREFENLTIERGFMFLRN